MTKRDSLFVILSHAGTNLGNQSSFDLLREGVPRANVFVRWCCAWKRLPWQEVLRYNEVVHYGFRHMWLPGALAQLRLRSFKAVVYIESNSKFFYISTYTCLPWFEQLVLWIRVGMFSA